MKKKLIIAVNNSFILLHLTVANICPMFNFSEVLSYNS
jgi:hypothetical protein